MDRGIEVISNPHQIVVCIRVRITHLNGEARVRERGCPERISHNHFFCSQRKRKEKRRAMERYNDLDA